MYIYIKPSIYPIGNVVHIYYYSNYLIISHCQLQTYILTLNDMCNNNDIIHYICIMMAVTWQLAMPLTVQTESKTVKVKTSSLLLLTWASSLQEALQFESTNWIPVQWNKGLAGSYIRIYCRVYKAIVGFSLFVLN